MLFYEIHISLVMIFDVYIFYKKHDDDKNCQSNQRKFASIIAIDRIFLLPTVMDIRSYLMVSTFKKIYF